MHGRFAGEWGEAWQRGVTQAQGTSPISPAAKLKTTCATGLTFIAICNAGHDGIAHQDGYQPSGPNQPGAVLGLPEQC